MALPTDDAELRALDARCSDPLSPFSKGIVKLFAGLSVAHKRALLQNSTVLDLAAAVRCLLEAGLSPNTAVGSGEQQRPVLVLAASAGRARVMKVLLDAGADVLAFNGYASALYQAARQGFADCIALLLAAGADANGCDRFGNTPLMAAGLARPASLESFSLLLPVSDLSIKNHVGLNVLHMMTMNCNEGCFDLLLPRFADDIDSRTAAGFTPGGAPSASQHGMTALQVACQFGHQPLVKKLLKHGADRMARDSRQSFPLLSASSEGHLSCVVRLLERPSKMSVAEVNAVDDRGATALHDAAMLGHTKVCGVLIQAGARLDAKTRAGHTPLMIAQHEHPGNAALLALLSGAGPAHPPGTVCDHCGKTPAQANVNILKACGNCHAARFCGADCAAAAWPGHKVACRARMAEVEAKTKPKLV